MLLVSRTKVFTEPTMVLVCSDASSQPGNEIRNIAMVIITPPKRTVSPDRKSHIPNLGVAMPVGSKYSSSCAWAINLLPHR